MSAVAEMAPDVVPEDIYASLEQTLDYHPETVSASGHAEIARLAYALWQQRGCPEGSPEFDWLDAERQLNH